MIYQFLIRKTPSTNIGIGIDFENEELAKELHKKRYTNLL